MSTPGPFGRRKDPPPPAPAEPPAPPPGGPGDARAPLEPGSPRPPSGIRSFSWLLGVAAVLLLAYVTLNTVRTDGPGSRGVAAGRPLPPFAVPLATSARRCGGRPCDANVARRDGSGLEGRTAACRVRAPDILNSCELAERGPVALAFLATRSDRCEEQVDVMERVRRSFPGVQFAVVAVRGDQGRLRRTLRKRGWTLPVGYDHDGAVSTAYAVALCPTITFARRGGVVESTSLEFLGERALAARVRELAG
jgi:hypothetical protein